MRTLFFILFNFLFFLSLYTQSDVIDSLEQQLGDIPEEGLYWYKEILVFNDTSGTRSFEEVKANPDWFQPNNTKEEFKPKEIYWAKILLKGHSAKKKEYLFHIAQGKFGIKSWDYIDVWLIQENEEVNHRKTGFALSKDEKQLSTTHNFVRFEIDKNEKITLIVKLRGVKKGIIPNLIQFGIHKELSWAKQTYNGWRSGVLYGVLGIQFLYFFVLFFIEKEKRHLYFAISILGLMGFFFVRMPLEIILNSGKIAVSIPVLGLILLPIGLVKFSETYFNPPKNSILSRKVIPYYILLFLFPIFTWLLVILGLKESSPFPTLLLLSLLPIGLGICIYLALVIGKENKDFQKYYLIAFSPLLLVLLIAFLNVLSISILNFSILPNWLHESVDIATEIAIVLMLFLLAISSGYRTNQLKKDKEKALQKNLSDQKHINQVISRFVPNEFLRSLGKTDITQISLGDHQEKIVTVFFSDIRAYTSLSEQMTPTDNFKFVQAYNSRMGPIIENNHGFINQYLGDGIMAIFPQSPDDALKAAIQMQQAIQVYNQERISTNRPAIKVGMGMHTGSLIMGIIGDANRMDAATISDSVNTAARIEGLTKHYGASILVSDTCIERLRNPNEFHFRYLGEVQVKGKKQAIKTYECYDGDIPEMIELKLTTHEDFDLGIQHYFEQSFTEAASYFKSILQKNQNDATAKLFLTKTEWLLKTGVAENWTGVEMMDRK